MKAFKTLLTNARQHDDYWAERAKLEFSCELERLRKLAGLKYADLARKLGTSPAYVTKVFRGDANLSIETMVKFSRAVDGELRIHIAPQNTVTRWYDVIDTQKEDPSARQWAHLANEQRNDAPITIAA